MRKRSIEWWSCTTVRALRQIVRVMTFLAAVLAAVLVVSFAGADDAKTETEASNPAGGELSCSDPRRRHFSDVPARGYHVLVAQQRPPPANCSGEPQALLGLRLHIDGIEMAAPPEVELRCSQPAAARTCRSCVGHSAGKRRGCRPFDSTGNLLVGATQDWESSPRPWLRPCCKVVRGL